MSNMPIIIFSLMARRDVPVRRYPLHGVGQHWGFYKHSFSHRYNAGPSNKRLSSWVANAKGRLTRDSVAKKRQKYRALGLRNHSPRVAPEINMGKYASASKRPCVMSLLGIGHGPDTKSVSFAHSPHWKFGRTENRAAFCDVFPA